MLLLVMLVELVCQCQKILKRSLESRIQLRAEYKHALTSNFLEKHLDDTILFDVTLLSLAVTYRKNSASQNGSL